MSNNFVPVYGTARSTVNIGETLARFQAFLNIPLIIDWFSIKVRLRVTMGARDFFKEAR